MAVFYLDSSALVKRYVSETGSAWVRGLCDPSAGHTLFIARITGVEIIAAITRRARGGTISAADAATGCAQFRLHQQMDYQLIEMAETLLTRAMALAEARALRGYDAVQLAAALELHTLRAASRLPALTFISADGELNAAATAEGLLIDDPNTHP